MLKPLALIILLFFSFNAFAQKAKHKKLKYRVVYPLTSPHDDCVFTNKYSLKERLAKYPFNKAIKIIAIGYKNVFGMPNEEVRVDTIIDKATERPPIDTLNYGLHVKNGVVDTTSFRASKKLTDKEIASLTHLLFNTDYRVKGNNGVDPGRNCFTPRNALLFYDKHGKIFDYLEICFECQNFKAQSEKYYLGTDCMQKMDLLKKWFISLGITYGTVITED